MAWAPDYVTEDRLGSYLRIDDTQDDAELALAITGASRAIDQATNRQFGSVSAEERFYTARYNYERCRWVVDVDDFQTTGGLAVTVDGTAVTNVTAEPRNAVAKGRAWTRLSFDDDAEATPDAHAEIGVSLPWGWTAVPDTIVNACLLQSSRFFGRRNAPFGIAGSPDVGSEMRLLAKADPDVEVMVRAYRRTRAVG